MVVLLLVEFHFQDHLTDLHLPKLIITMLTFRDISKFPGVNTAINVIFYLNECRFILKNSVFTFFALLFFKPIIEKKWTYTLMGSKKNSYIMSKNNTMLFP